MAASKVLTSKGMFEQRWERSERVRHEDLWAESILGREKGRSQCSKVELGLARKKAGRAGAARVWGEKQEREEGRRRWEEQGCPWHSPYRSLKGLSLCLCEAGALEG